MPVRHEKLSQSLNLIMSLSGTRTGLTVREMMAAQGCGRRTIERLLKAIDQACGTLEQVASTDREKRWRLRPTLLNQVVAVSDAEIGEIEAAALRLHGEGQEEAAARLRAAAHKLRAQAEA